MTEPVVRAIAAADRITDPVQRGDIMRAVGAKPGAEERKWAVPGWPEPLPSATALRLLFLTRPDLIQEPY